MIISKTNCLGYEYIGEKSVKASTKPVHAYKVVLAPQKIGHKLKKWRTSPQVSENPAAAVAGNLLISKRKRLPALLLCLCFGIFGAHRFYAGKIRTAKAMLFTIGGIGLWYLADIVIVLVGELPDDEGKKIKRWV